MTYCYDKAAVPNFAAYVKQALASGPLFTFGTPIQLSFRLGSAMEITGGTPVPRKWRVAAVGSKSDLSKHLSTSPCIA